MLYQSSIYIFTDRKILRIIEIQPNFLEQFWEHEVLLFPQIYIHIHSEFAFDF